MSDLSRYDPVWRAAEPFLRVRKNDIHIPLSFAWCARLLDHHPEADRDICLLAILLHDIGWYAIDIERILDEAFTGENMLQTDVRYLHESEGVRLAGPVLAQTGFGYLTAPVCEIIDGHDTRPEPRHLNDRIVRDADKLWRFEVAGIAICCDWMKMTPHAYADRLEQKILPRLETEAAQALAADQLARSRAALRLDVI